MAEIVCLRLIVGLVECAGGEWMNTNGDMAESVSKTTSSVVTNSAKPDNRNDVEKKGFLLKWTNYIKGYQRRWFVLSAGVLSYYRCANNNNQFINSSIHRFKFQSAFFFANSKIKKNIYLF